MKMILILTSVLNACFISFVNPMSMAIMTISQSLIMCYLIVLCKASSWLGYVMFLVFLGGVMILFMYMCSISPNESDWKKFNKNKMKTSIMIMFIISCTMFMENKMSTNQMFMNEMFNMFNKMFMMMTMITMIYLLMVLIISVMNVNIFIGPLRMKKKI